MKFLISTVDYYDADRVFKDYPCLQDYKFDGSEKDFAYVVIDSLEQLMDLMKQID